MLPLLMASLARATTLAVAPFQEGTSAAATSPLGAGLADMVLTDLCTASGMECIERSQLSAVLGEIELGASGFLEPSSAQQLGRGVGAALLVVGSISRTDSALSVDARVVDVQSARVLHTATAQGPLDDVFGVEAELVAKLADGLRVSVTAPRQAGGSAEGVALYGTGLSALDAGQEGLARTLLASAVEAGAGERYVAARLAALEANVQQAIAGRGDALTTELLGQIRAMEAGDSSACAAFSSSYIAMYGPLAAGVRIILMPPSDAVLGQWTIAGLDARPADMDAMALGVGQQLHQMHTVAEAAVTAAVPADLCPAFPPAEVARGGMLLVLGNGRTALDGPGVTQRLTMYDADGRVLMTPEQLDELFLATADAYVAQHPTGSMVPMLPRWVGPIRTRVAARSED